MDETLLARVHPLFEIPSTKIFINEVVQSVTNRGNLKDCFLIVTNSGIFLLYQKTFPKIITISSFIPFSKLTLMVVDENSMQFYSENISLILQHKKYVEISSIIYSVVLELYWKTSKIGKIEVAPVILERFNSNIIFLDKEDMIFDRFVAFCLDIPPKKFKTQQIIELGDRLLNSQHKYHVTADIVASPFADAYIKAISYDVEAKTIKFSDISLCNISDAIYDIIAFGKNCITLIFKNVSFKGAKEMQFQTAKLEMKLKFDQCDLTSPDFTSFFKSNNQNVTSLIFDSCSFTQSTLEGTMKVVLKSPTFTRLTEFELTRVAAFNTHVQLFVLQLFGTEFIINNKLLKTLTINDAALHVNQIIPGMLRFDNGVEQVSFRGNMFDSYVELDSINTFRQIQVLDISRCSFTAPALISLFAALSRVTESPKKLIADELIIPKNDIFQLYSSMPTFSTNLESFSWMKNPMTDQQMAAFVEFLLKQKKLEELSLSSDGFITETVETLAGGLKRIKKFTLSSEETLPVSIIPVLKVLKNATVIKLSNQGGGDAVFEALEDIMKGGKLKEVYFDGTKPSSIDAIINFCDIIERSPINISSWPACDVRELIQKEPIKNRPELANRAKIAKELFSNKMLPKKRDKKVYYRNNTKEEQVSIEDLLSAKEKSVASLVNECIDSNQQKDPLVTVLAQIQRNIGVPGLLFSNTM